MELNLLEMKQLLITLNQIFVVRKIKSLSSKYNLRNKYYDFYDKPSHIENYCFHKKKQFNEKRSFSNIKSNKANFVYE